MTFAIHLAPLAALFLLGIVFANRWLVNPPVTIQKYPRPLRIAALILACWAGTFVATELSVNLGLILQYEPERESIPDGAGTNVWNLLAGWSVGLICWNIAKWRNARKVNGETEHPA